ncbi:MobF family relaxase [Promicromonospora sp. NPDC019610]|uniref:MobF family relaxase n=1 Tax=Promicromonospora sp. NPDC019610 TaxID=3364405 RepID=UPI0037B58C80
MTVSISAVAAGDGVGYLLGSVVRGDCELADPGAALRYYTEAGTPPGRWVGKGVAEFGTGGLEPGATVTEQQLERLLGEGLDPVTGEPLGLTFAEAAGTSDRKVVAGFDLTFSAPKSVSVLWGLADRQNQELIAAAHHAAMAEVIEFFEREIAATRIGHGGTAQVDVAGVAAAAYDHWDSRAHDPQLHTHLVISNKVRTLIDGQWRALDSRAIYKAQVALSEHYNAVLMDRLTGTFGIGWDQRDRGPRRTKAWEITGVPEELIAEFSSRSRDVDVRTDQLIARYEARHGRSPSRDTINELRAQATLETRPEKQIRSLADLTAEWHQRATSHLGDTAEWAHGVLTSGLGQVFRADDVPANVVDKLGERVVDVVSQKRATWTYWNLWAEASRQTMGARFGTHEEREQFVSRVVVAAQARSLPLTPPEVAPTPEMLLRADGSSALRPRHHVVYSNTRIMAAETRLMTRSQNTTGPVSGRGGLLVALQARYRGHRLTAEQVTALASIAMSGRAVDVLVGPAGTGKTTAMSALLTAWHYDHGPGSVIGLAPSAAAAKVLADDLGVPCETAARWLTSHQHGYAEFDRGQLVVVDEASLASTMDLDRITTAAEQVGAKVLLVGDPAQLQSVDAGGAFGMLVEARNTAADVAKRVSEGAPTLTGVHRFRHDWEKTASLALRDGKTAVIDTYAGHDRISEGTTAEMTDAAYAAWQGALASGESSVLVAEATTAVHELNDRARADRILTGLTSPGHYVPLADGTRASTGDLVITRRNDRTLTTWSDALAGGFVRNGDRWQITAVHHDGSVDVRREGHDADANLTLPADYVAEHLDLGYAVTAHRAQGLTVDSAHVLVTRTTTRENLYVAMTRGRDTNRAYVGLDEPSTDHNSRPDEQTTARTVLFGVLQHSGAELSAHQTRAAEREKWTGIAQMTAEYDVIAGLAQRERWTTLAVRAFVTDGKLTSAEAHAAIDNASFWSLCTELRRIEAIGHDVGAVMRQVVRQRNLLDANDPCAVVHTRLTRDDGRTTSPVRRSAPLITGLLPPALGPMPDNVREALAERARVIEERASALASAAIRNQAGWVQRLGYGPALPEHGPVPRGLVAVAAYRDKYGITGQEPFGPRPSDPRQARERDAIHATLRGALHRTPHAQTWCVSPLRPEDVVGL